MDETACYLFLMFASETWEQGVEVDTMEELLTTVYRASKSLGVRSLMTFLPQNFQSTCPETTMEMMLPRIFASTLVRPFLVTGADEDPWNSDEEIEE